MLELSVKAGRRYMPLLDLPQRLGRAEAYREIGDAIDGLLAVLDDLDGDPDVELNGDEKDSDGDEAGDLAWAEWTSLSKPHLRGRHGVLLGQEDDEEDDDSGQEADEDDPAGCPPIGLLYHDTGPGCPISDPGGDEHDGREEGDNEGLTPDWRIDQTEAISDEVVLANDRALMNRHRDRIRRSRCTANPHQLWDRRKFFLRAAND